MTQLKIDNNPFAKGFRENGQLRVKKRQLGDISPGKFLAFYKRKTFRNMTLTFTRFL